jgi:hypothetical protein
VEARSLWYVGAALEGSVLRSRSLTPLLVVGVAALIAGCGGGTQAEDEPAGTYQVEITRAEFPKRQHIGAKEEFALTVRNTGDQAVPVVSVSVDGFVSPSAQTGLSDRSRPVWVVDDGPLGGDSAYVETWTLGRLDRGASRTFTWRVVPVVAGDRTVRYRVSAGLHGEAKATLADDAAPEGTIDVSVAQAPATTRVDPESGDVLRSGEAPEK